ncbi:hypothetical protein BX589_14327 [Paraburkholderia fungorum]|jgi:hypothetical protein|uniref:hypothetical protein n=1 Tax=Paraburkholderia fungorum TaxID=134537 RepID=UPI000D080BCC|nr:hypothetical protein [Paraburkholderia fungorum]PRZ44860.1 hypothetical protein BX589_14327 [Paraburkholderia fungorum]
MSKTKFYFAGLTVACAPAFAAAAPDGVTYEARAPYVSGAAVIAPANGGAYVYSTAPFNDGRGTTRFMLGLPPRQNYDLFSAQEEAALWQMREAQRKVITQANARARTRHVHRGGSPKLNWPKVLLVGDKTCVPQTGFANASDWQQHVVCWSAGDRRVE